jgi:hypothetical protein
LYLRIGADRIGVAALDLFITAGYLGVKVYGNRGIIARAIHQIFEEKESKPEAGIVVRMSYMEIYQEVCMSNDVAVKSI